MYWIQFSDFYDWPHIQLFDDFQHLKRMILEAYFQAIHNHMKEEHKIKKNKATRNWCKIIKRIHRKKSLKGHM